MSAIDQLAPQGGRLIRVPVAPANPDQLDLLTPEQARARREATITEAFDRFHRANPHVYAQLAKLALRWKRRGNSKCGIGMLFEVLRFRAGLATTGDEFKLNNNYRSRYARLLMEQESELAGFFDTRELKSS